PDNGLFFGSRPVGDSYPTYLTVANGLLYFGADDGVHGQEPWVTDGTAAGTKMLSDIHPGTHGSVANGSYPSHFTSFNGKVFFTGYDAASDVTDQESTIWETDGSSAGTVPLKVIDQPPVGDFTFAVYRRGWHISLETIEVAGGLLYFDPNA